MLLRRLIWLELALEPMFLSSFPKEYKGSKTFGLWRQNLDLELSKTIPEVTECTISGGSILKWLSDGIHTRTRVLQDCMGLWPGL